MVLRSRTPDLTSLGRALLDMTALEGWGFNVVFSPVSVPAPDNPAVENLPGDR